VIEPLLQAERALDVGLLDQAERLYRGVADSDPRNSIAVVGLARVALEREDEAGALALARRAVEIDPDNPMASRLVARLEEVLATRDAKPTGSGPAPGAFEQAITRPAPTASKPKKRRRRRGLLDRLLGRH
jgi:Tetratricopeptide repeat